jgi:hypothetical protein
MKKLLLLSILLFSIPMFAAGDIQVNPTAICPECDIDLIDEVKIFNKHIAETSLLNSKIIIDGFAPMPCNFIQKCKKPIYKQQLAATLKVLKKDIVVLEAIMRDDPIISIPVHQ